MSTPGDQLARHLQYANAARFLRNDQLADALMRSIWARLPFDACETALIEETLSRLRTTTEEE
jgi:hypothetical protein